MKCRLDCIQKALERLFYKHGKTIAKYPLPFLLLPIFLTLCSSPGFIGISLIGYSPEYLYTPINAQSKDERNYFQATFPENDTSKFVATRKTGLDGFVQVIITAGSGNKNLHTQAYFETLDALDRAAQNVSVLYNGSVYTYRDVCASWFGACWPNVILDLYHTAAGNVTQLNLTWPVHDSVYFIGTTVSAETLNSTSDESRVTEISAIMLTYFVKYIRSDDVILSDLWLEAIKNFFLTEQSARTDITISFQTSLSADEELIETAYTLFPMFAAAFTILSIFTFLSCLMLDWVRSKPWVALAGELSAGMAVVTSIGLLNACGVLFCDTAGLMPFLAVGIGIDDMYVILSSWRHTSYLLPVDERLGKTMETAAISITITSITDVLAFGIGAISPFRSVISYGVYTGFTLVVTYTYAITFLPAVMVYSGQRERDNRHSFTCLTVPSKDVAKGKGKSWLYRFFCAAGYHQVDQIAGPISNSSQENGANNYRVKLPESNQEQKRDNHLEGEVKQYRENCKTSPIKTGVVTPRPKNSLATGNVVIGKTIDKKHSNSNSLLTMSTKSIRNNANELMGQFAKEYAYAGNLDKVKSVIDKSYNKVLATKPNEKNNITVKSSGNSINELQSIYQSQRKLSPIVKSSHSLSMQNSKLKIVSDTSVSKLQLAVTKADKFSYNCNSNVCSNKTPNEQIEKQFHVSVVNYAKDENNNNNNCNKKFEDEVCLNNQLQVIVEKDMEKNINSMILVRNDTDLSIETNETNKYIEANMDLPFLNKFYRDYFSNFIEMKPVKIIVVILYFIYLSCGIYGCTTLTEGIEQKNLISASSYLVDFYNDFDEYFSVNYGPYVMVAITESIDYSNVTVRQEIYSLLSEFQNSSWFGSHPAMTESWLSLFEQFLTLTGQAPTNMDDFINILINSFLTQNDFSRFDVDIIRNENLTEITQSRFMIQGLGVTNSVERRDLMIAAREIASTSPFSVEIYNPSFIFWDQYTLIVSSTIQTLGIALASILLVSFLLLANILSIIAVIISVLSIMVGMFGYMALWDIPLNALTTIYLAMCIGFSVDFSAHICYHFAISKQQSGLEITRDTLSYLGLPITQSAVSTVLGVVILATSDSFIFLGFFKIVFLVMTIGYAHGVVFLPVILSTCMDVRAKWKETSGKVDHDPRGISTLQKDMHKKFDNSKVIHNVITVDS